MLATDAPAASRFDALLGAWAGSGRSTYHDDQTEPSNEIEIRGQLTASGDRMSGTWEERTFNASGEANGRFAANRMTLSITGGGFSGSMSVVFGSGRQVVTIATEGISLKSVTVTLLKSG